MNVRRHDVIACHVSEAQGRHTRAKVNWQVTNYIIFKKSLNNLNVINALYNI